MDSDTRPEEAEITRGMADWFLDTSEQLAHLALADAWDRWYWLDAEDRIVLEAADLTLPVFLRSDSPEPVSLMTAEQITTEAPFALKHWENNSHKFYLSAHHHGELRGYEPTMRYFVDVVTSDPRIADLFIEMQGGGKKRTREQILEDLWPCPLHPATISGHPNLADALEAWDRGDDEIQHSLARKHAEEFGVLAKVAEGRAKLQWGMIPLDGLFGDAED